MKNKRETWQELTWLSAGFAATVCYGTFLLFIRSAYWTGPEAAVVRSALSVFAFCWMALALSLGFAVTVSRGKLTQRLVVLLTGLVSVGLALPLARAISSPVSVAVGATGAATVFSTLLTGKKRLPARLTGLFVFLAALGGISALLASDTMLFLYEERIPHATRTSLVWFLTTLLAAAAFGFLTRRARLSVAVCVLFIAAPACLAWLIPAPSMKRVDRVGPSLLLITSAGSETSPAMARWPLVRLTGTANKDSGAALSVVMTSVNGADGAPPADQRATLAQVLSGRGYMTAAFIGIERPTPPPYALAGFQILREFPPPPPNTAESERKLGDALSYYAWRGLKRYRFNSYFIWVHLPSTLSDAQRNSCVQSILDSYRTLEQDKTGYIAYVSLNEQEPAMALGGNENTPAPLADETGLVDVAPTLVDLLGAAPDRTWQGKSVEFADSALDKSMANSPSSNRP